MAKKQKRAFDILIEKFDKIFILNMCNRTDRKNAILRMLKNIGYDDTNEKHNDFIEFVYASPWPYNDIITRAFNMVFRTAVFNKPAEYDCMRNHCHIMEIALSRNYNNILVMEDDLLFVEEEYFTQFIKQLPTDYSLIQMDGFTSVERIMEKIDEYRKNNVLYIKDDMDIHLWNMGMYAVSNKGMNTYLDIMFNTPYVADGPAYKHDKFIDFYCMAYPMAIQDIYNLPSNIRLKDEQQYLEMHNMYNKDLPYPYYGTEMEKEK